MDIQNIIEIGALVVAGASAITALTKTPKPNTWRARLYKVLEILALVVGRAKEEGRLVDK